MAAKKPRSAAQIAAQRKAAAASAAKRRGRGKPKPVRGVGRDGRTPIGAKARRGVKPKPKSAGKAGKKTPFLKETRKALEKALRPSLGGRLRG